MLKTSSYQQNERKKCVNDVRWAVAGKCTNWRAKVGDHLRWSESTEYRVAKLCVERLCVNKTDSECGRFTFELYFLFITRPSSPTQSMNGLHTRTETHFTCDRASETTGRNGRERVCGPIRPVFANSSARGQCGNYTHAQRQLSRNVIAHTHSL